MPTLVLTIILSCASSGTPSTEADVRQPARTDTGEADSGNTPDFERPLFSIAIIADPHVVGPGEHDARLHAAVDWVEEHAAARDIQLTVILGDICWGDGFTYAHDALNRLSMPWVPVMGDNVVQAQQEDIFHATFVGQLEGLHGSLTGFEVQPTPVWNPERGTESWLQNLRFDFGGIRFLSVDWNSREVGSIWGETPDLHDFEGGTWPWLLSELERVEDRPKDSVILLSHMPLFEGIGGLTTVEADKVVDALYPRRQAVWANLAGHLHWSNSEVWERAGIEVHVTDATWDDRNTIRIIDVSETQEGFSYGHSLEEVY